MGAITIKEQKALGKELIFSRQIKEKELSLLQTKMYEYILSGDANNRELDQISDKIKNLEIDIQRNVIDYYKVLIYLDKITTGTGLEESFNRFAPSRHIFVPYFKEMLHQKIDWLRKKDCNSIFQELKEK